MAQITIQQAFELALQHHQAGRLREAEQIYRQILAQQPEHVDAMHNLGVMANQLGRNDMAVDLIRRAIALRPNYAEAYNNLGNALREIGQLEAAIAAYRQAIALRPGFPDAHNNLGNMLHDTGQLKEAIAAFRQAIALKPNYAEAYYNLGSTLRINIQFDEAIAAYRQALALRPNYVEAHLNLGNALRDKGQLDEAIAAHHQAIALRPNYPLAYVNLGNALADKGQIDEAIAAYRQAIALKPDCAEAHHHLAMTLLLRGDFKQGWLEFEWRWKASNFWSPKRGFSQPPWDGSDLKGRAILLHAEQGNGDTIHFIRYLPLVVAHGGRVFVETQPELIRLLRQLPGVERWIPRGEPLPAFDVHCPIMSLPRLFQTTLQTIPSSQDILPDPDLAQAWRRRLEQQPPGFKVGLVWSGNPQYENNRKRSTTLALLGPLAAVAGIRFYSLQKGEAAKQAANPPASMQIVDWTDDLHDFADTAALVAQFDLIISVDTSVAHLAAAMGKPVWLLLQFVPDWRWLQNRDDCPWYPTMRLFRQTSFGDWPGVVRRVVEALIATASSAPTA